MMHLLCFCLYSVRVAGTCRFTGYYRPVNAYPQGRPKNVSPLFQKKKSSLGPEAKKPPPVNGI
jgi:hypothetical protein